MGPARRTFTSTPSTLRPGVPSILNAPLEVTGDWGKSLPSSAATVISRMREACLDGVRLLSDRQPSRLRAEDRTSGPPHLWLHDHPSRIAWIVVDVRGNFWCQLAYQFGHELGHVLDNSGSGSAPARTGTICSSTPVTRIVRRSRSCFPRRAKCPDMAHVPMNRVRAW